MKTVELYTDGACSGNPGPGGWAAILCWNEHEKVLSGGERETTNNRMELTAVIRGLKALKEPCAVTVYSDSRYIIDAMTAGWAVRWRKNGWKRSDSAQVKNPDLWERLLSLTDTHCIQWVWVKGHAENERNTRCDALAVMESRKYL